jgi:hypothetical protein
MPAPFFIPLLAQHAVPYVLSTTLYSYIHPFTRSFFAGEGQSQESTTSATMIEWLDVANSIFKSTNFEGSIGIGIQVKVAAVRAH